MNRVAVFVDAGYLFAQGSTAISDGKKTRSALSLDPAAAINLLKALALEMAPSCTLLRIYWYDGLTASGRPTNDQLLLAESNDVKLRLGLINSHGQQKGVDSLIVTDLIELARQKSISDALLLSGDEDIRVGVQIAQTYGVRVHLLGLHPSRSSQSRLLMQEADTTTEWMPDIIGGFLAVRPDQAEVPFGTNDTRSTSDGKAAQPIRASASLDQVGGTIGQAAQKAASELTAPELLGLSYFWQAERGVPQDIDKRLLGLSRKQLGRILDTEELKLLRSQFREAAKKRIDAEVNQAAGKVEPHE
jgi:uncharacterized LabA/DUF88 family protein